MNRYMIELAYRGTAYHGWQLQQNAHSVQGEINEKLSTLLGEAVNVMGCGRTDTGVHARQFFAHFDTESVISDLQDLAYKLNRFLPSDIVIFHILKVSHDLHARFSAIERTYRYYISRQKAPFAEGLSLIYDGPLDIEAMNLAAKVLVNHTDFTSFSKLHTQTKTNDCHVTKACFVQQEDVLIFTITADRFLRNMVRAVVGTLLEIGKGKLMVKDMERIILAKDRGQAGFSVPAQGLFLEEVKYPDAYSLG